MEPETDVMLGQDLGEAADATEAELIQAVRDAERGLDFQPVLYPYGGGVSDVGLDPVDPVATAMLEGAREALEDRQRELRNFTRDNLTRLAVERAAQAREITDECNRALRAAREAAGVYERERHWWTRTLVEGDRQELVESIPSNPLAVLQDAPGEVVPPLPGDFM